ncbi:MAG: hypothetical protein DIU69_13500, partial [Bacillota bacterium]
MARLRCGGGPGAGKPASAGGRHEPFNWRGFLTDALRAGLKPDEFWNLTPAEDGAVIVADAPRPRPPGRKMGGVSAHPHSPWGKRNRRPGRSW